MSLMLMCFSLSLKNEAMFHTDAAANITTRVRLDNSQARCGGKGQTTFACLPKPELSMFTYPVLFR